MTDVRSHTANSRSAADGAPRRPLRLWPGIAIASSTLVVRYVVPALFPDAMVFGVPTLIVGIMAAVLGSAAIILWWLFFSRATWTDRLGAIALMVLGLGATSLVVHQSVSNGMMGMMLPLFGAPLVSLALVASAVAGRQLAHGPRRVLIAVAMLAAAGAMTLVRTDGVTGDGESQLQWRWTPTPEERLLEQSADPPLQSIAEKPFASSREPVAPSRPVPDHETVDKPRTSDDTRNVADAGPAAPVTAQPAEDDSKPAVRAEVSEAHVAATATEWPGFRGASRDGVVHGVQIALDWTQSPPVELWRRAIGPGWSSFAVHKDLFYTQEQRGQDEIVSCYRLATGEPVWAHRDRVRFYESNGGPGPRGTPTVHGDRVYALGATGIMNALDARTGAIVWSRNASTDTGVTVPDWGVASSPLVLGDLVVVAVSGRLIAYDSRTGNPLWLGPEGGAGYSSPHLVTIDGVRQIVLLRGSRTISVAPADGRLLWEHTWQPGVGIVQPAVMGDDVLITAGDAMGGLGVRRISVAHGASDWSVEERWTSRGLKPYFNDFVVHRGYAFGFDGSILSSINLEDGSRTWKGGRYGHGQMLLLADQDVMLVLSEDGDLALVKAAPDQFTELTRMSVLNAKTWNHPVLVGDILLVRNGEEMAAIRLPVPR